MSETHCGSAIGTNSGLPTAIGCSKGIGCMPGPHAYCVVPGSVQPASSISNPHPRSILRMGIPFFPICLIRGGSVPKMHLQGKSRNKEKLPNAKFGEYSKNSERLIIATRSVSGLYFS